MHPLPIGKTDDPFDSGRILTIHPDARRKHMAIFGKSAVGKTTLLGNMVLWDIEHGAGVAVEEPQGGLRMTCPTPALCRLLTAYCLLPTAF